MKSLRPFFSNPLTCPLMLSRLMFSCDWELQASTVLKYCRCVQWTGLVWWHTNTLGSAQMLSLPAPIFSETNNYGVMLNMVWEYFRGSAWRKREFGTLSKWKQRACPIPFTHFTWITVPIYKTMPSVNTKLLVTKGWKCCQTFLGQMGWAASNTRIN